MTPAHFNNKRFFWTPARKKLLRKMLHERPEPTPEEMRDRLGAYHVECVVYGIRRISAEAGA